MRLLMRAAREHAEGRVAAILEGGYDMQALAKSVLAVVDELGGRTIDDPIAKPQPHPGVLAPTAAVHRNFWDVPVVD